MATISAISVCVIVDVGGVQAISKTILFIYVCFKFEVAFGVVFWLLPVPLSYAFLLVEYRKCLPFILLVPVDTS